MDIEEDLNASNKRLLEKVEEISVDTFTTAAYGITTKKLITMTILLSTVLRILQGPQCRNNISK